MRILNCTDLIDAKDRLYSAGVLPTLFHREQDYLEKGVIDIAKVEKVASDDQALWQDDEVPNIVIHDLNYAGQDRIAELVDAYAGKFPESKQAVMNWPPQEHCVRAATGVTDRYGMVEDMLRNMTRANVQFALTYAHSTERTTLFESFNAISEYNWFAQNVLQMPAFFAFHLSPNTNAAELHTYLALLSGRGGGAVLLNGFDDSFSDPVPHMPWEDVVKSWAQEGE